MLDAELRESANKINSTSVEKGSFDQQAAPAQGFFNSQANTVSCYSIILIYSQFIFVIKTLFYNNKKFLQSCLTTPKPCSAGAG